MRIELTQGYSASIDEEDSELVSGYSWCVLKNKHNTYAKTTTNDKTVLLHRLIAHASDIEEVDHIDGDGLNNQRGNLRICTSVQNKHNTKVRCDNALGYRGVYYNKREDKYYAQIKPPEELRVFIGSFDTPEEAALAYNKAAFDFFGEFARCNVIRAAGGTTSYGIR